MKIFISMGMKSKGIEQVRQEMSRVFEAIKNKLPEVELIDSVIDGADKAIAINGDDSGIWYLGESLKRMSEANIVFFINNWKDFRGCSVERTVAERYGKFCVDFEVNY
jgi:hypothetical protein